MSLRRQENQPCTTQCSKCFGFSGQLRPAFTTCGCILMRKPRKSYQRKPCSQRCRTTCPCVDKLHMINLRWGPLSFYAFPSAASSRKRRPAIQIAPAPTSGAVFSPSGVLTFTVPSSTAYDPLTARPLNSVVICFQRIGFSTFIILIEAAPGVHPAPGYGFRNKSEAASLNMLLSVIQSLVSDRRLRG
jgi:hypothetical protein